MAAEDRKPRGLLAILSKGDDDEEDGGDDERGEAGSKTARALKSMFRALEAGDWDEAAADFRDAYESCASGEDGEERGEDEEA